ncbi:MAG: acyloxyacyl hydrolase [Balneolaceae bacterium]|nr:acyloxyacyl hydrolase [Balneolaceae bacterium]
MLHLHRFTALVFILLYATVLYAQPSASTGSTADTNEETVTPYMDQQVRNRFSIWAGYSFNSATIIGETANASLGMLGINYNRRIFEFRKIAFEYSADLNFFANYDYPEFNQENSRNILQGLGFSPVGFQLNFDDARKVYPYFRSSGGLMVMEAPFPDNRGTKLNFTFELGAGLEFAIMKHTHLFLGYKYHHLSNGETGQINPGVDSNLFYGGLTIF